MDKILVVLFSASGVVSTISFKTVISVGIASAIFTLIFPLTTRLIKKLLSTTRNKKKKHDKILALTKSKLNSIESLVIESLIDIEISHEELVTI